MGSPLFPDGIISPLWVRRYREQVPAVYLSFHCLSQLPGDMVRLQSKGSAAAVPGEEDDLPPSLVAPGADEGAMLQHLKANDEALIKHIAESLRSLTERGIKLTVVLLTTRDMLCEDVALQTTRRLEG